MTKKAYDVLVDYAIDLGVEQAFIQEGETAKESFIPDFPTKECNEEQMPEDMKSYRHFIIDI